MNCVLPSNIVVVNIDFIFCLQTDFCFDIDIDLSFFEVVEVDFDTVHLFKTLVEIVVGIVVDFGSDFSCFLLVLFYFGCSCCWLIV